MMRNVMISALLLLSTPAHAEWFGMIFETGGVRQAHLTGYGDVDGHQQINVLCTTAGVDLTPMLDINISLPATGEYSIRQGDAATAMVTLSDRRWDLDMVVEANSSSGFLASAGVDAAKEIAAALESSPAEMSVSVLAGPIEQTFTIFIDKLDRKATEWMDGCGR